MGRKSTKENKTIYQISREAAGLTREGAADLLKFISADRIERIESEKSSPYPEEVLAMSGSYRNPALCNYYCSNICPIGQQYVPEIKAKELSQITLEMLATLNILTREEERLIEIVADGEITPDEMSDFLAIKEHLAQMSAAIDSLKLWLEKAMASGEVQQ